MPTEEQTYREGIRNTLDDMNKRMQGFEGEVTGSLGRIEKKVEYTNGKVRKIIIALVLIGGIIIGQLFTSKEIISLIASVL